MRVDRLVVRAMLACLGAAVLMLANRWIVAGQQADALARLLTDNARTVSVHALQGQVNEPGQPPGADAMLIDILSMSPHHLAAILASPQGGLVGQARDEALPYFRASLGGSDGPLDGAHFDRTGVPAQASPWHWQPAATAVEIDAGEGRRLRLLVSLQLARENQQYIFIQGVKSVALALLLVLGVVLFILRRPRSSLVEASRFAAALPHQAQPPLPRRGSSLAAIDTLRDALNQVNELLEVQRRQHQIDEGRLQQAARQAEADAEAKSQFLAHMSHEIRTPLNGVLGLTRLLLDTPLSALQKQQLRMAHESASHLLHIVNDVLDHAKVEAGRLRLESVPFSLYGVLDEACKPFALHAADKSIELINEVCPNLPLTVIGDPMRLRQILVNLIGNAVKFTEQGHVRLHVEGTAPSSTLASARQVVIAFHVSDTGPGIADEHKAQLFEAFMQADASTARQHGGTGLGLNITGRLLELMGTRLQVESQLGRGSRFSFELSFELPPLPAQGHLSRYDHLPGQRVLWVDGSGLSVPWYRTVFGLWSIELDPAPDLDTAVHMLDRQAYRAVFFDNTACRKTTEETLQALLNVDRTVHLCLMLGAGDSMPPLLEGATDRLGLIVKPASPQDLNRALSGQARLSTSPMRLEGLQLLVVDDNEVNRLVATATLESLGARVSLAEGGQEALRCLQSNRFDAVLMDLQMPGIDGFEATRRLRAIESERGLARMPVLAMTASGRDDESARILAADMDGFVGKPMQNEQLLRELHAAVALCAATPAHEALETGFRVSAAAPANDPRSAGSMVSPACRAGAR